MKISREIKTAVLVLSAVFLFIFGFSYLKGKNIFKKQNVYYTTFEYNALAPSAVVTLKGNIIGKVEDITYDQAQGKTVVKFSIDTHFPFSKNSTVRMYETGFMSGNGLAIIPANDTEWAQSGDFLKSEVQTGLIHSLKENFSGLSTGLDGTLKTADTLLHNLNDIVLDKSNKGLKNAIAELNSTIKSFKGLSQTLNTKISDDSSNLNKLITDFSVTAATFKRVGDSLEKANIGETVGELKTTLKNLNSVIAKIDQGEGTIGKLMKDEQLYNNLEGATKELEELLQDIKLHPKRYFRILSKKEIPYKEEQQ